MNNNFNPEIRHRVRVLGGGKYGGHCLGQTGVVMSCYGMDAVAVALDHMFNKRSARGYFYFSRTEIEPIETNNTENTGEKEMEKLTNYVNVAEVSFLNDNTAFRTIEYANYEPDLAVGDLVVVKSAHHGMGLAEVIEIKDHASNELYREIVAKVDTAPYNQRVAVREEAAELKAKMQERAKQLQDIVLYQTLAKEDPEMAKLLGDFMALNK